MQKMNVQFSRVKELPGIEFYRRIDAASFVPRHVHGVFSLNAVDAGAFIHETKQEKYGVTPGSIFVVNIGDAHSGSTPAGYNYSSCSIRIAPTWLHTLITQITGSGYDSIHLHQPVIQDLELSQHILNLQQVLGERTTELEKECLMLDLLAKLLERHATGMNPVVLGNEHTPISRVCEYLQDCSNENVSLEKLSKIAGLSPFHLARIFSQEIGVPPHTYQLQVRLRKATDLLALGRPIVEVALETGFCDQSHFQKAFKKKFGITPRLYKC